MTSDIQITNQLFRDETNPILRALRAARGDADAAVLGLQQYAQQPNTPAILAGPANVAAGAIDAPRALGQFGVNTLGDIASQPVVQKTGTILSGGTVGDLQQIEENERAQRAGVQAQEDAAVNQQLVGAQKNFLNMLDAGAPSQSSPLDLGPVSAGGGGSAPTLPPLPPPTDYTGVYDAVQRTRPEPVDEKKFETMRNGSFLMGILGGVLAADNPEDIGNMLLNAGYGGIVGISEVNNKRMEAEEKFKEAMNQYWLRIADIRGTEARDNAQHARDVWNVKKEQLLMNYRHAQSLRAKDEFRLMQVGSDLYTLSSQDGRRVLNKVPLGMTDSLKNMHKNMSSILGGTEEAAEKASAILGDRIVQTNPEIALPMVALYRMEMNGMFDEFIKIAPEAFAEAGQTSNALPVRDEGEVTDLASNKRRALAINMMLADDRVMLKAMQLSGLGGRE